MSIGSQKMVTSSYAIHGFLLRIIDAIVPSALTWVSSGDSPWI